MCLIISRGIFLEVGIALPSRGLQLKNFKRFPKYKEWGLYRYPIMAYIDRCFSLNKFFLNFIYDLKINFFFLLLVTFDKITIFFLNQIHSLFLKKLKRIRFDTSREKDT